MNGGRSETKSPFFTPYTLTIIMSEFFETPEQGPQSGAGPENPISFTIDYKSGRTPGNFAAHATPEQSGACFSYWNRDAEARFTISDMTLFVLGSYWKMAGEVGEGDSRRRFTSNYVTDMRTEPFYFREKFVKGGGQYTIGLKDEVRAWATDNRLEDATRLMITLICYVPELNAIVEVDCSRRIEDALGQAIEAATGKKPARLFQLGFNAISTEYWAFRFDGRYVAADKDGKAHKAGELFWQPVFQCGVVRSNSPKTKERFDQLEHLREPLVRWVNYVNDVIADKYKAPVTTRTAAPVNTAPTTLAPAAAPVIPSYDDTFPTEAPPPPATDYGEYLPF